MFRLSIHKKKIDYECRNVMHKATGNISGLKYSLHRKVCRVVEICIPKFKTYVSAVQSSFLLNKMHP